MGPLEDRVFKYKRSAMQFFCPLCRTERAISTGHRLTKSNYIQIAVLALSVTAVLWTFMSWRGVFSVFPIFVLFEGIKRSLFRKEVPCPHCGFDAGWYKRDVKVAKQLVADFWAEKKPGSTEVPALEEVESFADMGLN